jgi:hypothetical protein
MSSSSSNSHWTGVAASLLNLPKHDRREEPDTEERVEDMAQSTGVDISVAKQRSRVDSIVDHLLARTGATRGRNDQGSPKDQVSKLGAVLGATPPGDVDANVFVTPPLGNMMTPDVHGTVEEKHGLVPVYDTLAGCPRFPDAMHHVPGQRLRPTRSTNQILPVPPSGWSLRALVFETNLMLTAQQGSTATIEKAVSDCTTRLRRGKAHERDVIPICTGRIEETIGGNMTIVPRNTAVALSKDKPVIPVLYSTAPSLTVRCDGVSHRGGIGQAKTGLRFAQSIHKLTHSHDPTARTDVRALVKFDGSSRLSWAMASRSVLAWVDSDVNATRFDGCGPFLPFLSFVPSASMTDAASYAHRCKALSSIVFGARVSDGYRVNIVPTTTQAHGTKRMTVHLVSTGIVLPQEECTGHAACSVSLAGYTIDSLAQRPPVRDAQGQLVFTRPSLPGSNQPYTAVVGCFVPPVVLDNRLFSAPLSHVKNGHRISVIEDERTGVQDRAFACVLPLVQQIYNAATQYVDQTGQAHTDSSRRKAIEERVTRVVANRMSELVLTPEVAFAVALLVGIKVPRPSQACSDDLNLIFTSDALLFFLRARDACSESPEDAFVFFKTEQVIRTGFYPHVLALSPWYAHQWAILYHANHWHPKAMGSSRSQESPTPIDLKSASACVRHAFGSSETPDGSFAIFIARAMQTSADLICAQHSFSLNIGPPPLAESNWIE